MVEHLYDGWPHSFTGSLSEPSGWEYGTPITVQRTGTISGLRYYHRVATDTPPTSLALWSWNPGVSSPTLIERVTLPSPGSTTGWIDLALGTPYDVGPGDTVVVSGTRTAAWHVAYRSEVSPNFQPRTMLAALSVYGYYGNVGWASGGSFVGGSTTMIGFDFERDPAPFGDFTLSELTDEFQRWLTAGGDKYPESDLPAIKGQAEGANTNANNAWETAQEVQTDLGAFRDEWPGTLATALQGGLTTIGDWLSTESDWYKKLVHDSAPGAASLVDKVGDFTGITVFNYLADLIRWANGVNASPQLADTTDWELLDETDFVDNLLWPVEADVYRVTLSAFDPAGTSEPVGTETRHAYLGKWCSFNVQFSSEWHYFNTSSADLYSGGRMPGLGLILYRPGAGHVQAWRRVEAP